MTDLTSTQDALVTAHKQGHRFVLRIEGGTGAFDFADFIVEAGGASAGEHAMRWLKAHDAKSVAAYRILPDGKRNFIRFYDYRDLEEAA
tara:strand:- start:1704 stop:1970 length:267 start_codon:yes stop_codon:yes gene_type:complete